jgi:AcrR family transcriptional regulator
MDQPFNKSRRERIFDSTRDEIKAIARRQMAEQGAVNISLRAIARDMGMTAPALYRYYANYDELITALIVDAFRSLGDALEDASQSRPASDYVGRFLATALEYRSWALAHREEWGLIFGNPIPGYEAPGEITIPVVRRAFMPLLEIVQSAWHADQIVPPIDLPPLSSHMQQQLAALAHGMGYDVPIHALHTTLLAWSHGHGLVMLELYNHIPYLEGSVEEMYRIEIMSLLRRMGMQID